MNISRDSADYYTNILQRYAAGSNAVITALAGRNSTAGIVTAYNTTSFVEELQSAPDVVVEATTIFRGHSFYLESLPPAGSATILQFMEADNTPHVCIAVDSTGIISAYRGNQTGTLLASAATPIQAETEYYLEYGITINAVTGSVEVRLWLPDGVTRTTIIDFSGNTLGGGAGTISKLGHGTDIVGFGIPPSARWDDFYCCDDQGTEFNTFQGNKHVHALLPQDAGFYTNWSPSPAPPNYANVDEAPPNETDFNLAPDPNPETSITLVGVSTSSTNSCAPPPGVQEGDFGICCIRTNGTAGDSNIIPDMTPFIGNGTAVPNNSLGGGVGGLFLFDPFADPGSLSNIMWCEDIVAKLAGPSEPVSYTFTTQSPDTGEPLEDVVEIVVVFWRGVHLATPVEDTSNSTAGASITEAPPSNTIEFAQVDSFTDVDLIVAIQMAETQAAPTPTGYTNVHASTSTNISTKVKSPAGGEVPPSTIIGAVESWGTSCMSLRVREQVATGGKDTFPTTPPPNNDSFAVNLVAKQVDGSDHTVGAASRQGGVDTDSATGATPDTDFKIYQFNFETPFNEGGEAGYALDTPAPTPPPEESVIFEVDAANYTGTFGNGDPVTSIVETGQFGLTLSLAGAVAGDFVEQTFDTSDANVNNEPSIVGITESLACTPATRNLGYLNTGTGTGSPLFLPSAFTIAAVINITQFEGCWQNGQEIVIVGRKGSTIANFCGWQLQLDGGPDPGGQGEVTFIRRNSVGGTITILTSGFPTINENQTYLIVVICDGATVRMRLDGVEVDTAAYVTSVEPLANNQLNFLQQGDGFGSGNAEGPPQGSTPFCKIWEIEYPDLATLEADLMTRFGI